jgi:YVTN family beta-propeller protein
MLAVPCQRSSRLASFTNRRSPANAVVFVLAAIFLLSLLALGYSLPDRASAPPRHVPQVANPTDVRWIGGSGGGTSTDRPHPAGVGPGVVESTLDLVTNQILPGNRQPTVQDNPEVGVFDPDNGMIYVRGYTGNSLSVVNTSDGEVVTEIDVPYSQNTYALLPTVAVDPTNGLVYTTNYNEGNVSVIDPATNAIVGSIPVDNGPYGLTYDPQDGDFYVAGYIGNNVTAFSPATDRTVANISVGRNPTDIDYDPDDQQIYVINYGSDNVSAINTTLKLAVANLPTGADPSSLTVDTADDYVDVAASNGGGQGSVTIIDGASDSVTSVVAVGDDADSLAYATPSGRLYVANGASDNVSVLQQPSDKIVRTLAIGHGSGNIEYDPLDGDLYSANYGSNNISVINASHDTIVGTITTGNFPYWTTVDTSTGAAYVVNGGTDEIQSNLTVLSGTSVASPVGSIPLNVYPTGLAYDPNEGGNLLVGDPGGDTVYRVQAGPQFTTVAPAGSGPEHLAYDPDNHDLYVVDQRSENVTVLNRSLAPVASVPLGIGPTGIAYDAANHLVYVTDDYGGNVTVINATTNLVQGVITIKPYDDLTTVFYDPHNTKVYVADSSGDNLSVINGTSNTLVGSIRVGLDPDSLAFDSTNDTIFVANVGSGNLSVVDDATDRVVHSVAVYSAGLLAFDPFQNLIYDTNSFSPAVYAVNASNYSVWSGEIYLGDSQGPTGIAYDPALFETVVATEYDDSLSFIGPAYPPSYWATFQESGLPNGTAWSVEVETHTGFSSLNSSTTSKIGIDLANGSYFFIVVPLTGYAVNVTTANFTILGAPVMEFLAFSASSGNGTARFVEVGLPSGTLWNVTFDGITENATGSQISFTVPVGYHAFAVPNVGDYLASPSAGSLLIPESPLIVKNITFSNPNGPPTLSATLTADPSTFFSGGSTTLQTVAIGGIPPYTYAYGDLPEGCAGANSSALRCAPSAAGYYNVTVTVTDPAGQSARAGTELTVQPGNPAPYVPKGVSSPPPTIPPWAWGLLGLLVVVGIVAGILTYRRRRQPPPTTAPYAPAIPPAPP